MKNLKVVFMGTPSFSVPVLEKLIANTDVVLVVSQPDREKDRKGNLLFTPTKELALAHNIPVLQPLKVKDAYEEIVIMKCLNCDFEEEAPYDIIEECWEDGPYPIGYCPHCDKPKFVPLDIYNKKKKK